MSQVEARRDKHVSYRPKDKKAKLLGSWCHANFSIGLEAFTLAPLTRAHNWAPEEVILFLVDQRKAMSDKSNHAY
jgi:hypothetical protein